MTQIKESQMIHDSLATDIIGDFQIANSINTMFNNNKKGGER